MFIKMTDVNNIVRVINADKIIDFSNRGGNTFHVGLSDFGFEISQEEMINVVVPQLVKQTLIC